MVKCFKLPVIGDILVAKTTFKDKISTALVNFDHPVDPINFDNLDVSIVNGDDENTVINSDMFTTEFKMLEDMTGFTMKFDFRQLELIQATIKVLNTNREQISTKSAYTPPRRELETVNANNSTTATSPDYRAYKEPEIDIEKIDYYKPDETWSSVSSGEAKQSVKGI